MEGITQEGRNLRIETPLGTDVLLALKLRGEEQVSRLFRFEVECFSLNPDLNPAAILGRPVTIAIRGIQSTRHISGIASRFRQGDTTLDMTHYYVEVVPWLWLLTRTADCRIFQEKTVPEIVSAVFDELDLSRYELDLQGEYATRAYCVQYRESAFAFVSRLLEEEGIWYFFRHEQGSHTLVLADHAAAARSCPSQANAHYNPETVAVHDDELVFAVSHEDRVSSTNVAMRDFNYEAPRSPIAVEREETAGYGPLEVYDFPGEFPDASEGNRYAAVRMEEHAAIRELLSGASNCRGFAPGFKFELKGHPRQSFDVAWKILKMTHEASEEGSYPGSGKSVGEFAYTNRFEAMPADTPFRPARITPRPRIAGAQTAVVTGPDGEEIHTDRLGRVKVHFHWDRLQEMDDTCSCWVRVSQGWAGKNWGMAFLPRIGHEVIVEFLEGDPDRPLITGRVHNAEALPPYDLPANKEISGIKTRSTTEADPDNLNVIRFNDKKGVEELFVQAEHSLHIRAKADRFESIGNDRHLEIERDKYEEVKNNRHVKAANDHLEEVGKDRHLKVTGKEAKEVGASLSLKVGGDVVETFNANHKHEVTQTMAIKALSLKLEASTGIELKCGGSSIVLTPAAIFVVGGPIVNINSGSGPPVGPVTASGVSPAAPGAVQSATTATTTAIVEMTDDTTPHQPDENETSWIEIELVDENDDPIPGEVYRITLPDGTVASGTLDGEGRARVEGFESGNCDVTFPRLDEEAWEPA